MAAVAPSQLDHASFQSLSLTYAALILHDSGKELSKVLKAANAKVDSHYPQQFANALKHGSVGAVISGAGNAAPAAGPVVAAAPIVAAPVETKKGGKKEEKKKVEEEEEDMGGAVDLFGGDDY